MYVVAMALRTGLVTVRNRPPIDDCPECERGEDVANRYAQSI